jgi:hypothetical protein
LFGGATTRDSGFIEEVAKKRVATIVELINAYFSTVKGSTK